MVSLECELNYLKYLKNPDVSLFQMYLSEEQTMGNSE
jgi:hypothetical protein